MIKPDIIIKYTIKKSKDGSEWIARCSALPNCAYACLSVPDLLRIIEKELYKEFKDATYIDGGITSMTAEYPIFRQKETNLEKFLVDSAKETAAVCEEVTSLLKRVDTAVKEGKIEGPAKDLHDVTIPFIASEPKAEPAPEENHA